MSYCDEVKAAENCNWVCGRFQTGKCPDGRNQVEIMFGDHTEEEIETAMQDCIEPVKRFTLHGIGKTDIDIIAEDLGY